MPDDVSSLRSQVERLRKAATRKVSRLKTAHDVYLTGTTFDPRRKPHVEAKYNARQLKTYANQLQEFLSRKTQYVPDSQRRPVPREKWREYKALEDKYNQKIDDYFSRVAQMKLPSGETIAERMAKMKPEHPQMANPTVNAPYRPPNRDSTAISSRKSLEDLKADMERRLRPEYFDEQNKSAMEQFEAMARIINEPKLADDVRELSGGQFAILWNYTSFATAVSLQYEAMLKMLSDKEQPWHSQTRSDAVKDAQKLIKWAKANAMDV